MDQRRGRRSESPLYTERRTSSGKCQETVYEWSRRPLVLGMLVTFMGLSILFPIVLTCTSIYRQRLFLSKTDTSAADTTTGQTKLMRIKPDETLGGLLPPPDLYEDGRCISRMQEYWLRSPSKYRPSSYLISKIRQYELRHRKCAHEATRFSPTNHIAQQGLGECQFIVWIANSGLGNRIMTLASAFVYALLTDRVLLIDQSTDIDRLFCEPFPGTSWLLPQQFPYDWMQSLDENSACRLGRIIQNGTFTSSNNSHAFLNLMHNYDDNDRKFFCEVSQAHLQKIPWLFMRSNNYFVPGLHFIPRFNVELEKMFRERETVFHHISRYLLRPSNSVWGLILRFYKMYLATTQHQVGLQIRVLDSNASVSILSNQVLSCAVEKNLLPNVTLNQEEFIEQGKESSISVLVASLHQDYYEKVRQFYLDHPTKDGRYVGVHTPSHEGAQYTESFDHDKKAWADMYLLSFSDTLVTSPWSTFGYVAQGISGVTPWILTKTHNSSTAEEAIRINGPCNRGLSFEPCFHSPPVLDCDFKGWGTDPGKILPFIKHCEDVSWGIKIIDRDREGSHASVNSI